MTGLAVLAGVALAYALVSKLLDLSAISAPMVFVGAGILAGPNVLGLAELKATQGTARLRAGYARRSLTKRPRRASAITRPSGALGPSASVAGRPAAAETCAPRRTASAIR
jgi:hypothetical protein